MTNEERDIITKFIARVGGQSQGSSAWGGSVPSSSPQLPPIDREADQFINEQFQRYPEARYRITQMALVQEAALVEAQNRMQRMQWEIEQTRNAAQQASQQMQAQPQQSRGILSSLFGGGGGQQQQRMGGTPFAGYQPTTPPPQPQYPPQYQPGMFQRGGGSGFLGTALAGATGVEGGMLLGNALTGLFSGNHGSGLSQTASDASGGLFGGGGLLGGSGGSPFDAAGGTNINDPTGGFADAGSGSDPWASGGADKGFTQEASFDNSSGGDPFGGAGGYDSGSSGGFDGGGGFDSGSGGFDDQNT